MTGRRGAARRARHAVAWTPDVLGVERLWLDGAPTPYYLVPAHYPGDRWGLWDGRPPPDQDGPPSGWEVRHFATRRALERWVAAGGLPWP